MKSLFPLFVSFFLFISLPSAFAFEAYGTQAFRSCDCQPIVSTVFVTNDEGIVQVSAIPLGKTSWITLAPDSILLLPNENATFNQFINPSCSTPGLYDIGVRFSSGSEIKDLRQQISVGQCELNESVVVPSEDKPIDVSGLEPFLIWSSVALTIILGFVLVFIVFRSLGNDEEKPQINKAKTEPIVLKRPLRYSWEQYFKRKSSKDMGIEPSAKQMKGTWIGLVIFLVLIIIILVIWMLSSSQTTLLESLNQTSNLTPITSI